MYLEDCVLRLIRISLGTGEKFFNVKRGEWERIYEQSSKLGVCGMTGDSLQQLGDVDIAEELYYKWLGQGLVKDVDFSHHAQVIKEFASCCLAEGVKVFVLKGLAFGVNYPNPRHRPCGDIDVFCVTSECAPAYQIGNEVAQKMRAEVDTHWYKHSQINYKGIVIENHEYLVCTRNGRRYKELNQKLTCLLLSDKENTHLYDTEALIPSSYFSALFQAYHSCSHFLAEGIGLKHVLDWATFLKNEQGNIDWNMFYVDCEKYHLKRFIVAMTDIVVHKLGIRIENPNIEIDSPYSDKLLNSILYDDAKVFSTPGGAWNHRIRLIRNAFKYRWKFTEIAQESFLRHIFVSIWGFFFHTEDE